MVPIDVKRQCERRVLATLDDAGLPPPDEVEFGEVCVRFLWHDSKVALVVDLVEFEEIEANGGYTHDGLSA